LDFRKAFAKLKARRSVAIALIPFLLAPFAFTGCGVHSSVTPHVAAAAACNRQASSVKRTTRDELTDSPPWEPDAGTSTNEMYTSGSSRTGDYYDSDLSGAPLHTTGGGGRIYLSSCEKPASQDRHTSSYPQISYTCWYQARTPGVHNIYDDWFLGCTVDFTGGYDPNVNNGSLLAYKGGPVDGAVCAGSPMAIGDLISIMTAPDTYIADMNAMWNGNKVIGWMYKGDNGQRFVQMNYQNQAGVSLSVPLGPFSIGFNSPGGYSEIEKWNGMLPPGTRLRKCFTKGSQLA
jgi:hypothetical protein